MRNHENEEMVCWLIWGRFTCPRLPVLDECAAEAGNPIHGASGRKDGVLKINELDLREKLDKEMAGDWE